VVIPLSQACAVGLQIRERLCVGVELRFVPRPEEVNEKAVRRRVQGGWLFTHEVRALAEECRERRQISFRDVDNLFVGMASHALTLVLLQYGFTEGVEVRGRIPQRPRVLNQSNLFMDHPPLVDGSCPVQILFHQPLHPKRRGTVSWQEAVIELVTVGGLQVLDDEARVSELLAVVFNGWQLPLRLLQIVPSNAL